MRSYMPWQAPNHGDLKSSQRIAVRGQFLIVVAFVAAWLAFSPSGAAQTSGPIGQTQPPAIQNVTPTQPSPAANPAAPAAAQSFAERRRPDWPVNAQAAKAKVEWNSRGLYIVADNSSLKQILEDVSAATGVKLDGLGEDERVFGAYGPGAAREVLSNLLDGTEYNVLMSGDQGQGTPREIVLSRRPAGSGLAGSGRSSPIGSQGAAGFAAQNAALFASQNAAEEETAPEEPQPVEQPQAEPQPAAQPSQQQQTPPQTPRSGFGGGAPRTPQQIIQEMQERQQQLQQQQNNNSQ
jgi:hypothetical protein